VPDTYFNVISAPAYKAQKCLIGVTVSRTALNSTSLPITITLTNPPNSPLRIQYTTIKPA